jgi:FixJ family two-component response regulator
MKGAQMAHEHRIAVVDDDQSVREAAASLFRSMGFTAIVFASAEDFLASDAPDQASCLVLDVQMPGMDGLSLQRHLAATGRHIPIVFVTGYPDAAVRDVAMQLGAVCFLTKPCKENDLVGGLRSALAPAVWPDH